MSPARSAWFGVVLLALAPRALADAGTADAGAAAAGSTAPQVDAGGANVAGTVADAGVVGDAGALVDASSVSDAGAVEDASAASARSPLPSDHPIDIRLSIAPENPMVGDALDVRVILEGDEADRFSLAERGVGAFEVLDFDDEDETEGGRKTSTFRFALLALEPGTHSVGPFRAQVVTANGQIHDVPIGARSVTIHSRYENDPNFEAPGARPPEPVMVTRLTWGQLLWALGLALLLVLCGLFAHYLYRRHQANKPAAPPPPPTPPWEIALAAIDALARTAKAGLPPEAAAGWADALSDALRRYLGDRFGFDGMESTTSEVLGELRRRYAPAHVIQLAEALLRECDLVQFANAGLTSEHASPLAEQARELVERSRGVVTRAPDSPLNAGNLGGGPS